MRVFVCVCVCVWVCMYMCMCVIMLGCFVTCLGVHVRVFVCICACIHECICIYNCSGSVAVPTAYQGMLCFNPLTNLARVFLVLLIVCTLVGI